MILPDIPKRPPTPRQRTRSAHAFFFARVERVGVLNERDPHTMPLFPLSLILDADGTLAAPELARRYQA